MIFAKQRISLQRHSVQVRFNLHVSCGPRRDKDCLKGGPWKHPKPPPNHPKPPLNHPKPHSKYPEIVFVIVSILEEHI